MYPVIYQYNSLKISSYGLMLMFAFLICNYLLKQYLISINEDKNKADDIIFYAAIGGILGAKSYYIIERIIFFNDYSNLEGLILIIKGFFKFDIELIINGINQFGSGLVFLGGLIGGMLMVSWYIKRNSLNWLKVSDWVAPYLALGHAIGRIGCFLVGDCYGKPCIYSWGITFKQGLPPTTYESFKYNYPNIFNSPFFQNLYSKGDFVYVHPTQLYEFVLYIIIFLYLLYIRKKSIYDGLVMLEYLFLAGIIRFLVEFLRLNPTYYFDLSIAQYISIAMVLISSYYMYSNKRLISKI